MNQQPDRADGVCHACGAAASAFDEHCAACGQESPVDDFVGRVIRGNIKIESVLGSGGMGTVYRGVETHLDRPVAVKVLNATYLTREQSIPYFNREAKVLSRLRHPNLVSVLDFGTEDDGTMYLVLEYIPGQLLFDVIHNGDMLSFERGIQIIMQVLGALSEAHRHSVIHRDLKPGNVMVEAMESGDDFVKVLDFGISKFMETDNKPSWAKVSQDGALTMAGMPIGTPEFMSPEQAKGIKLDARSDIYGAGIMLYEVLTKQVPFEGESVVTLLVRKVTEQIPAPSTLRAEIPPYLDEVVLKSIALEPDDRYRTAAEFREALADCLAQMAGLSAEQQAEPAAPAAAAAPAGAFFARAQKLQFDDPLEEILDLDDEIDPLRHSVRSDSVPVPGAMATRSGSSYRPIQSPGAMDALLRSQELDDDDDEETQTSAISAASRGGLHLNSQAPPRLPDLPDPQPGVSQMMAPLSMPDPAAHRPRKTRSHEFSVLIVLPVVLENTPMRRDQLEALGNYVTEFAAEAGGTVIPAKYSGVQVLFETNKGQSSLVRAAEAALRMRQAATRKFPFVRLKMGIDFGKLAESGKSGATISHAAEKALKLARRAEGAQILAAHEHASVLRNLFQLESKAHGVDVVNLSEFGGERSEMSQDRSMTADIAAASIGLVGREAERRHFDAMLERINVTETGNTILLSGGAGTGKSYLVNYLRRLAQDAGLPFLEARCNPEFIDRAFDPLLDIAVQASGARTDSSSKLEDLDLERFREGLTLLGLESADADCIVQQYASGTAADPRVPRGRPLLQSEVSRAISGFSSRERRRVFGAAMKSVLRRLTGAGGAIVVIEDVHLADVNSLSCLAPLSQVTKMCPLLFVVTSETTKLKGLERAEPMALEPIEPDKREHFVTALMRATGKKEQPEGMARLMKLSGGSPLYLARCLEAPVETPSHDINLLLTTQVAQLPRRIWRLIIIAALLGNYFEESMFQGLFPNVKVKSVLEGAAMMGYFSPAPGSANLWRFRNPLVRNASLLGLDADNKIRCHKNILKALTRGERLSQNQTLLEAYHASEAGLGMLALDRCEEMGDRFAMSGDIRRSEKWYRRALASLAKAVKDEKGNVTESRAVELALKLGEVLLKRGYPEKALEVLERLHPEAVDARLRTAVLEARIRLTSGDHAAAGGVIDRTLRLLTKGDPRTVELLFLRAEHAARTKQTDKAVEILYDAQKVLDRTSSKFPRELDHYRWLVPVVYGELALDLRRNDHAIQALKLGFKRALTMKDSVGVVDALRSLKYCMNREEHAANLIKLCKRALESQRISFRPTQKVEIYRTMSSGYRAHNDPKRAIQALRNALGLAVNLNWESARQKIQQTLTRVEGGA